MIDWNIIRQEWETSDVSFVELAEKHELKPATIRSRKNREKWQRNATNVATQNSNATKKEKAIAEDVKSVMENNNLTDKQKLFCIYYNKYFNATKAYQKAYGVDYLTANAHGYKLLSNVVIKEEIYRLKQGKLSRAMFSQEDLFQMYLDIATARIDDFVDFGADEVVAKDKEGNLIFDDEGNEITYLKNYVNFKDSKAIDGALVSEVSQGRDGVKIKLQDKMKAMEWLDKHMGLATEEQKARISKVKAETEKLTTENKKDEPPVVNIINRWDEDE